MAVVETPPPVELALPGTAAGSSGSVAVKSYANEKIVLSAQVTGNALLVLSEKYYKGWQAYVDGKHTDIHPVNHVLRGVYLTPGTHSVEFVFDPLPFKVGKRLTLASMLLFAVMLGREWWLRRRRMSTGRDGNDPAAIA
jgi:uncharacterized membrane protein YfhO